MVPPLAAPGAIWDLLTAIGQAGQGSFLAVLKTFGRLPSPGLLSFPMEGTTLAVDFANRGTATLGLLARLDDIVRSARGRLYPAKRRPYAGRYVPSRLSRVAALLPRCRSRLLVRVLAESGMSSMRLRVIILGATSGIASATARLYAAEGAALLLAGRDAVRLGAVAQDLRARGATSAFAFAADFVTETDPEARLAEMTAALGGADHVLVAYGLLGVQATEAQDGRQAALNLAVNFSSAALWVLAAANLIERQGHGSLVVLGSVAGDRGRRANYVYGAAKSGLATLVEGIAHRFGRAGAPRGLRAVIVKPGPTRTAMTAGMRREGPMWAEPGQVAAIVRRAADRGGPVVYAPGRWRWIMLVIRTCRPAS